MIRRNRLVAIAHGLVVATLLSSPSVGWCQAASAGSSTAVESAPNSDSDPAPVGDEQNLAKQLSNPISSLISVPFQWNIDFGGGPDEDGVKSTLNIQPVVPISIASNWNMIVRTILPVIYQDQIASAHSDQFGLGDTVQSFFFSPKKPGPSGIVWGVGPVFLYPTGTDRSLSSKKWGTGPTFVVLKQQGQNTFGMLANHIWSVAGDNDRPGVSATFLQPFFSHTTKKLTTYSINTETTYDWKTKTWIVPINVLVAQLTKMGAQRVQVGIGGRYYVVSPEGGPNWGVRFVFTLLFPKQGVKKGPPGSTH